MNDDMYSQESYYPRARVWYQVCPHKRQNRADICLQTLLLSFKCTSHTNKRPFVSTANEALVSTLMTIGDVNDVFAFGGFHVTSLLPC